MPGTVALIGASHLRPKCFMLTAMYTVSHVYIPHQTTGDGTLHSFLSPMQHSEMGSKVRR